MCLTSFPCFLPVTASAFATERCHHGVVHGRAALAISRVSHLYVTQFAICSRQVLALVSFGEVDSVRFTPSSVIACCSCG
ncbi:uncharacterized protein B0H18DRAFT_160052 [Fomitopsis serialis]|uniref:uncharacterized protein n=1 Tax=Fomitopsis serialis TaxID=139415 RepID=UPI0020074058|nr:uncharacterized protein B0H18DRAFT_160052 [Neoantrodia serialis]KAH9930046.1 hypothetical protein B0H18DRAFT_160052 [Neoantrodia serialis]